MAASFIHKTLRNRAGFMTGRLKFDLFHSSGRIDLASSNRMRHELTLSRWDSWIRDERDRDCRPPQALAASDICIYSSHARSHVTPFCHVIDGRVVQSPRAIKRFVSAGCQWNRSRAYRVAFCRQRCDCRDQLTSDHFGHLSAVFRLFNGCDAPIIFVVGERCWSLAIRGTADWKIDATLWTPC